MERVEVDGSLVPADLVGVADAPAHGVEDGHDDAAGEHHHPREQQHVRHEDEEDARCKEDHKRNSLDFPGTVLS